MALSDPDDPELRAYTFGSFEPAETEAFCATNPYDVGNWVFDYCLIE